MNVGTAREELDASFFRVSLTEALSENLRALERALLAFLEFVARGELQCDGLRSDHVHERAALLAREHRRVNLLREILLGEKKARAGTRESLVNGRRHDIGKRHRARVETSGHKAREVRHIDPQLRANFIGDRAEGFKVEVTRVCRPPCNDHVRVRLEGLRAHTIHVDAAGLGIDLVGRDVVELARKVDLHAVGEVPAVREGKPHKGVASTCESMHHSRVCGRTRVGLHVRVVSTEKGLRTLNCQVFRDVHELAATVVALARVALGVFVRENRPLGLKNRPRNKVLARDHFKGGLLAVQFLIENLGDLRVDRGNRFAMRAHMRSFAY